MRRLHYDLAQFNHLVTEQKKDNPQTTQLVSQLSF